MESPSIPSLSEDEILLSPMHSVAFDTSEIEAEREINGNNNENDRNNDNDTSPLSDRNDDEDNSLLDECSCTSDEFYGRDMIDYTSFEDESEWYQYLNEFDRLEVQRGGQKSKRRTGQIV